VNVLMLLALLVCGPLYVLVEILYYLCITVIMAALCTTAGHYIFVLWFLLLLSSRPIYLFSSPNLSRHRLNVYHISTHVGLSANLECIECMSEMCCTRLAENTGRKNDAKIRHLRTIAQLCPAISLQLRHVLTIGKNLLNSNISPT